MQKNNTLGTGFLMVLCGLFFVASTSLSAAPPSYDPAHRAALEQRLGALEQKKIALEEVSGSLDQQRQYQARIDKLKQRLGQDIRPFEEGPTASMPTETSSSLSSQEAADVDYFHDRSQVVAVDQSIHNHGGIRPHSSLLDDLPRTNLSRAVAAPPKKGIVIDGSEGKQNPVPVVATASDLGRPLALSMREEPKNFLKEPRPEVMVSSIEPPSEISALPEGAAVQKEASSPSVQPLSFPQGAMPPPLWGQAASRRDYANKTGWSMDPVPITTPLFYTPPPAGWGAGMPQAGFPGGMAAADPSPGVPPFPGGASLAQDPRLSFSPRKLLNSWPQR